MSLQKIEQLVLQLDGKWFKNKKEWFLKEPFYNKKQKVIIDDSTKPEVTEDDITDLKMYCWSSYYNPYGFNGEQKADGMPLDGLFISNAIIKVIAKYLIYATGATEQHTIISEARNVIRASVENLLKETTNDDYEEALDYFLSQTRAIISNQYGDIKRSFDIIQTHKDKLEFNLNQDELAVLLQILDYAGFIHRSTPKDITYQNFYRDHFHFENQRSGNAFTRADGIAKRLSDVRGKNVSAASIEEVTTKLQHGIRTLKK